MIPVSQYRYIQVVTSFLSDGRIHQMVGTTTSTDKKCNLDTLLYRHYTQIGNVDIIQATTILYMSSEGELSHEVLPRESHV